VVLPERELRDLYERQGLSFDQIAAQLNVPGTVDWLTWVVSGLADEYGIHRQPRRRWSVDNRKAGPGGGNPAPRTSAPSDPRIMRLFSALSVEPQQIPVTMRSGEAWVRVQRFIDIAQYRDFSSAAKALEYSPTWASCLIDRLEADLDHVLIERAVSRRQPMSLTRFGERLLRAAARIDVDDKCARSLRAGRRTLALAGRPGVRTAIP
jgi:Bacterial regulatory helix-turn-helix protein, lysR family